jgi:uncharacterized protein YecT (DUF1311 family)
MIRFIGAVAAACLLAAAPAVAKGLPVKTLTIDKSADGYDIAIEYPATGNAAVDREIAGWAKQEADDFVKLAAADHQPGETAYGLDVSFEVARNDGAVFAVIFSEETDTGGAHPNHDFATFNFEVPSGWRLYLPEIFDGHKGLARISALAIADLARQSRTSHSDGDTSWSDGAGPDWDNFRDFILQKDKLEIHFPPYQVASYADGEQETDIPLAALKGLTRSDRHAPAASFDCGVAGTPIEKAICSDVALARLDRDVAEAYLRALSLATDDAPKEALKSEQRAWLSQRDAACPNAAVDCLGGVYKDRLAKLGNSR